MDRMDDVVEYTLKIMLFLYDIGIIEHAEEKGNWMLQTVTKKDKRNGYYTNCYPC